MASLVGQQLKDTYDSLLKTSDNDALGGTYKEITDGSGNGSGLYLGTGGNVGIGDSSPAGFTRTLKIDTTSGTTGIILSESGTDRAGIYAEVGTTTPAYLFTNNSKPLAFNVAGSERMRIGSGGDISFRDTSTNEAFYWDASDARLNLFGSDYQFSIRQGANQPWYHRGVSDGSYRLHLNGTGDIMTLDSSGKVGISSISPDATLTLGSNSVTGDTMRIKMHRGGSTSQYTELKYAGNFVVNGSGNDLVMQREGSEVARFTSDGLCFGGDFATVNALDDYEEGTWTPTLISSGGSGSPTYTSQLGTYTKIGRQVVVQFFISFQKNTLSGGTLAMQGFPFTSEVYLYPESAILFDNLATALSNPLIQIGAGTTSADLIQGNGGTSLHAGLDINTYLSAGTMSLRGTITYFV